MSEEQLAKPGQVLPDETLIQKTPFETLIGVSETPRIKIIEEAFDVLYKAVTTSKDWNMSVLPKQHLDLQKKHQRTQRQAWRKENGVDPRYQDGTQETIAIPDLKRSLIIKERDRIQKEVQKELLPRVATSETIVWQTYQRLCDSLEDRREIIRRELKRDKRHLLPGYVSNRVWRLLGKDYQGRGTGHQSEMQIIRSDYRAAIVRLRQKIEADEEELTWLTPYIRRLKFTKKALQKAAQASEALADFERVLVDYPRAVLISGTEPGVGTETVIKTIAQEFADCDDVRLAFIEQPDEFYTGGPLEAVEFIDILAQSLGVAGESGSEEKRQWDGVLTTVQREIKQIEKDESADSDLIVVGQLNQAKQLEGLFYERVSQLIKEDKIPLICLSVPDWQETRDLTHYNYYNVKVSKIRNFYSSFFSNLARMRCCLVAGQSHYFDQTEWEWRNGKWLRDFNLKPLALNEIASFLDIDLQQAAKVLKITGGLPPLVEAWRNRATPNEIFYQWAQESGFNDLTSEQQKTIIMMSFSFGVNVPEIIKLMRLTSDSLGVRDWIKMLPPKFVKWDKTANLFRVLPAAKKIVLSCLPKKDGIRDLLIKGEQALKEYCTDETQNLSARRLDIGHILNYFYANCCLAHFGQEVDRGALFEEAKEVWQRLKIRLSVAVIREKKFHELPEEEQKRWELLAVEFMKELTDLDKENFKLAYGVASALIPQLPKRLLASMGPHDEDDDTLGDLLPFSSHPS